MLPFSRCRTPTYSESFPRRRKRSTEYPPQSLHWIDWGEVHIHLATSTDLIQWTPVLDQKTGLPQVIMGARARHFDSGFPESRAAPSSNQEGHRTDLQRKNSTLPAADARKLHVADATSDKSPSDGSVEATAQQFAGDPRFVQALIRLGRHCSRHRIRQSHSSVRTTLSSRQHGPTSGTANMLPAVPLLRALCRSKGNGFFTTAPQIQSQDWRARMYRDHLSRLHLCLASA